MKKLYEQYEHLYKHFEKNHILYTLAIISFILALFITYREAGGYMLRVFFTSVILFTFGLVFYHLGEGSNN